MRLATVLRYVGIVLLFNALFLLMSAIISAANSDSALFPLLYTCIISILFGVFPLIYVPKTTKITNNEGLTIVVGSWLLSCLIGTLPYLLWGGEFTFTNAWFESVSGYTTTGSSILTDIEALPLGLLFWRSATHWIGGMGILIFVLSVLPAFGSAGMILYRTEVSSLARENFRHRTRAAVNLLLSVYLGLTVLESVALMLSGMNAFDAVTHSFATVATGGFSPKNLSIAHYDSLAVEIVIIVFMILSGIHFGLLFSVVTGNIKAIWRSSVVRFYLAALLVGVLLTTINLHGALFQSWARALRYAAFQVVSLGTSTGFATTNSSVWPGFSQIVLIFFTLQCACAGSTSGGIKVDRLVMFFKAFGKRFNKMLHPTAVISLRMNDKVIGEEDLESNLHYLPVYLGVVLVTALMLAALGVDSLSSFSGSAAVMGNVGPGLGTVGSTSNFAHIPMAGKWILTVAMLLGRLEIFTLLVFFTPKFWK